MDKSEKDIKASSKPFLAGGTIMMTILCAAGIWVKQTQKQAQTNHNQLAQKLEAETNQLREKINEASSQYLAEANRINAEQHDPLDPEILIQQLYKLKDLPNKKVRTPHAFYCLQGLLLNGTNSLPALKDLLIDGYDFDLDVRPLYSSRTLRQEIATLLAAMGNRPAADLLSQLLPVAQTVEELTNLCKALLNVSDGYRPYCISAARDMYNHLNDLEQISGNQQDIKKIYNLLFTILRDEKFAIELLEKREWLQENGNIDSDLFNEAKNTLPSETVMDYCYEGYLHQKENHRKTDYILLTTAKENIANPKATEMLLATLKDSSLFERYSSVMGLSLDSNFGATLLVVGSSPHTVQQTSNTEDPNLIQKANDRLLFLDAVEAQFPDDEKMLRIVGLVRSNLQHTASTDPDKGTWVMDEESISFFQDLANEAIDKTINQFVENASKRIDEKNNKQKTEK
jgi:hypothetical protein